MGLLLAALRRLMPREDRAWLDALTAELPSLSDPRQRFEWLAGALYVFATSFWRRLTSDLLRWPLALLIGLVFAYSSPQRGYIPEIALYEGAVGAITFVACWSWRWAVIAGTFLHIAGAIGLGPYHTYAFDAPLPVLPGLLSALIAGWLGRRYESFRGRLQKVA
jgi:hypothetical protein